MVNLFTDTSYDDFGGEIIDYAPVEDPQTDLNSEASNSLRASCAGMTNTCFRVELGIYLNGGAGYLDSINAVYDTVSTPNPTVTRHAAGTIIVDFSACSPVYNLRGELQNLVLLGGIANPDIANPVGYFCTVYQTAPLVFYIYTYNTGVNLLADLADNVIIHIFLR